MAKQKPDVVITRGKHTLITTNNHTGEVSIKWDWDKLLEEVREAMINHLLDKTLVEVQKLDNLVTKTETILKKSRKKKKEA